MTCVLSWLRMDTMQHIVHPRWWQFWKRARLESYRMLVRHCLTGIPQDEADLIIGASNHYWNMPMGRLLTRLMGPDAQMVQLENENTPSWYVGTGHTANKLLHSEARFQRKRRVEV